MGCVASAGSLNATCTLLQLPHRASQLTWSMEERVIHQAYGGLHAEDGVLCGVVSLLQLAHMPSVGSHPLDAGMKTWLRQLLSCWKLPPCHHRAFALPTQRRPG